jgi:hypothetical protein
MSRLPSTVKNNNRPVAIWGNRTFALQPVSGQKDKLSIKKRVYKAALDIGYLKKTILF